MADERVSYEVAARFTGEGELRRGASEFDRLAAKAKGSTGVLDKINAGVKGYEADWKKYTFAMGAVAGALVGVTIAAQRGYATLRAGAELQTTTERFGKLAASIGTTADVMLGKLRTATKGMISDAELMASASGIVSLKLADNEEQVVRLAAVVGTLGWDMQQVILTFANLSTMRLDALGLSVDEVKQKQKELMDQGMSTAAAFKEAVIQAGEARLDVGGVSETEQALKQAEAAMTNFKNSTLQTTVAILDQAGAFSALRGAAENLSVFTAFNAELERARAAGEITEKQYRALLAAVKRGGVDFAEAQLQQLSMRNSLTDVGAAATETAIAVEDATGVLGPSTDAWQNYYITLARNSQITAAAVIAAQIDMANSVGMADRALANAQNVWASRNNQPYVAPQARTNRYAAWVDETNDRNRRNEEERAALQEAEAAVYSYGGAMSYLSTAEQEAAESHSRFMSSFNEELRAKPEDGLVNAEGVINVEAMNKALYEQVEAAGASAATMALLGVATGQFTQEQAEAALKAAVLHEQIRAIAESVVAGDVSIGDALGQLNQARAALDASNLEAIAGTGEAGVQIAVTADTTTADSNLDGTAAQLDSLTSEEYIATVGMDINAVIAGTTEASRLIGSIPDTKTMTIRWEQSGADVIAALRALGIIV